jgi:transcriptional regulator with XRE-family HTH domain
MKRDTPKDAQFKKMVRKEFLAAIKRARKMGYTVDGFAQTLGITRSALHKYTRSESQSIPNLRVLDKARKIWKMQVSYGEIGEEFIAAKAQSKDQMEFQFSIESIAKENIKVQKVTPKGTSAVEVLLKISFSKPA